VYVFSSPEPGCSTAFSMSAPGLALTMMSHMSSSKFVNTISLQADVSTAPVTIREH
jgi:hypothetical protein